MLYDINNTFYADTIRRYHNYRELLNRSCYRLDIPINQIRYMINPGFQHRNRFYRNRRLENFQDELYQYKIKIQFCMDDSMSFEEKTLVLQFARDSLMNLNAFLMGRFNRVSNNLDLEFLILTPQAFVGLYEVLLNEIRADHSLFDVVSAGRCVLSRWSSYFMDLNQFFTEWFDNVRQQLNQLDPLFEVDEIAEEIERFEESRVIESPGLSIGAQVRLLGSETDIKRKVIFTSWNIRLGFKVNGPRLRDDWLENLNLINTEGDPRNVPLWKEYLGYEEDGQ